MTLSRKLISGLRWSLLGTACAATLLALFVVEENWRGDRAWAAFAREWQARDRPVPLQRVPDDRNLFKTPLLARVLKLEGDDTEKFLQESGLNRSEVYRFRTSDPAGLAAFRDDLKEAKLFSGPDAANPAVDVLTALQPLRPLLDELSTAARSRPDAGFDLATSPFDRPLHSSLPFARLFQALNVRAFAELAVGKTDEAFADIYAELRISSGLWSPPLNMMNLTMGLAGYGHPANSIVDGIRRHAWSEAQLAEIQRQLLSARPLSRLAETFAEQRRSVNYFLDSVLVVPDSETPPLWLFHGWRQQNKVMLGRHFDVEVEPIFSVNPPRIFPDRITHLQKFVTGLKTSRSPFDWASQLVLGNINGITGGIAHSTMRLETTAVLCALERHRLAHGHYPDKLDALVPEFLTEVPRDIFDGEPLRFETLRGGRRQLFSAGLNGRDDRDATGGSKASDDDIVLALPDLP